jgi:heme-degrading monooxygenase HmoA
MSDNVRYRLTFIHSVPDYERWADVVKKSQRRRPGVVSVSVFRSVDDPNEVMVDIELESAEVAQELLPSEAFRDVLDRSGIEIYPPVFLGEIVDELSMPADGS